MMLTDLADACRAGGLTVIEEPGWTTRGHGPMVNVAGVVCHHTAGPATGDTPSLGVVVNGRSDLAGPLCNLYLSRSGVVHVVAAGLAYHAGVVFNDAMQGNGHTIGIEAEATGTSLWPAGQYAAFAHLCRVLMDHYRFPLAQVMGHKEVAAPLGRKQDPNFDMPSFRAAVLTGVPDMDWTDVSIPDYSKTPAVKLGADVTLGWMALHAGQAAASAASAVTAANAVGAKVDALAVTVGALKAGGGTVDLDALAIKVADLLAARLAS